MLYSRLLVAAVLLAVVNGNDYTPIKKAGYCAMVGATCGGEEGSSCVSNTPAIPSVVRNICPHLQPQALACCDHTQAAQLQQMLARSAVLFARCPSCERNFNTFWCEVFCSPNQSEFVAVTSVAPGLNGTQTVNSTLVSINPGWAEQWYESCDNVQFYATGVPVFEQVFGASNYEQVFAFLGQAAPVGEMPFPVSFAYPSNTPLAINDVSALESCTESCMCIDCPATCPSLTPVSAPGMCAMYGTCGAEPDQYQNCVNNSFAVPATTYNVSSMCSGVTFPAGIESPVCCDGEQFNQLSSFLNQLSGLFGSCPACLSNLAGFYCEMICSPNQSLYVDAQHARRGSRGLPVVDSVQYRIDPAYANALWSSCSTVIGPNGRNAMQTFYNAASLSEFVSALAQPEPVGRYPLTIYAPLQTENAVNTTVLPIIPCHGSCPSNECPPL